MTTATKTRANKIDRAILSVYVVCEGEAYSVESAPAWLNQDNWMCDWMFVGAASPSDAVAVASIVDERCNKRQGRVASKGLAIMEIRNSLIAKDSMTPAQIYATQGNSVNSERLQFNQGWV